MKFGPAFVLTVVLSLLAGSSLGFTPSTKTLSRTTIAPLFVNSDPFNEDYDLEYAYRGDSPLDYQSDYSQTDYGYYEDVEPLQENRALIETTNSILRMLHRSFQNVEGMANELLNDKPVLALSIFVGAGLVGAYMLGLFFLDGCMESWNPATNGMVPYWDDEVLVLTRKIH